MYYITGGLQEYAPNLPFFATPCHDVCLKTSPTTAHNNKTTIYKHHHQHLSIISSPFYHGVGRNWCFWSTLGANSARNYRGRCARDSTATGISATTATTTATVTATLTVLVRHITSNVHFIYCIYNLDSYIVYY